MNEKTLKALVDAGAVRKIRIIGEGSRFHVESDTSASTITATTLAGAVKSWSSLDAVAKWVRALGIGTAQVDIARWRPEQRGLRL